MSIVTGHIVNHGQLKTIRAIIFNLPAGVYQPTNSKISLAKIDLLISGQAASFVLVRTKGNLWKIAVNTRVDKLKPLEKTLTKVLNALKATEAKPEIIADAKSYIDKIKGIRETPLIEMDPADPGTPSDESIHQISAAQTDINHVIEFFAGLINLLTLEPLYNPSEPDITIVALTALHDEIVEANQAVIDALPSLDNARIDRNKLLYGTDGGHDIAAKVKKYMLSIFGTKDAQYRKVSGLKFTKPKLYI